MSDYADKAQEREQLHREAALAASRVPKGRGTEDCVICGDRIPADRKKVLPEAETCVDCQTMLERGNRRCI